MSYQEMKSSAEEKKEQLNKATVGSDEYWKLFKELNNLHANMFSLDPEQYREDNKGTFHEARGVLKVSKP